MMLSRRVHRDVAYYAICCRFINLVISHLARPFIALWAVVACIPIWCRHYFDGFRLLWVSSVVSLLLQAVLWIGVVQAPWVFVAGLVLPHAAILIIARHYNWLNRLWLHLGPIVSVFCVTVCQLQVSIDQANIVPLAGYLVAMPLIYLWLKIHDLAPLSVALLVCAILQLVFLCMSLMRDGCSCGEPCRRCQMS